MDAKASFSKKFRELMASGGHLVASVEVSSITPRLGMTTRPITLPAPISWRTEFTYGEMALGYLETITALPHSASEAIDLLLRTVRFGYGIEDSYFYLGMVSFIIPRWLHNSFSQNTTTLSEKWRTTVRPSCSPVCNCSGAT
ncbi:MAG: hypothetical protein NDI69_05095 [Bacteriovoracaceae bacterium]|nr:hypothetical protein [Bacteriovoracaceae bacterium]